MLVVGRWALQEGPSMSDVAPQAAAADEALFEPKPVLRPREQVEEQIRQAILSGQLAIGTRLPSEAALASKFSVSRTTVREALRSLAANGLITKVPGSGGGSFVRSVDHWALGRVVLEGMQNLLKLGTIEPGEAGAVRRMLAVPTARLAAENRTGADVRALERILAQLARTSRDDPKALAMDTQFHTTVALASRNRVLACLIYALHMVTEPVRDAESAEEAGRRHQRLLDAIKAGDPDAAELAMTAHAAYVEEHPRPAPNGAASTAPGPVELGPADEGRAGI
ncbi:FadR family transcriptional regulator [Actinomadura madurae]|uniref:FadR/GntR family transcriptional regulator n=1 Tax=Actinomadura madurae TaxID=1993 RepID=UPI00399B850D